MRLLNQKGFSTIEALLAASILGLIVTVFMGAYIYGSQSTALAGQRARATFLAEEGLEATRNIRDASFSNLVDGTYGLVVSGNQWIYSGSYDVTDGFYTRQIVISTAGTNRKQIVSNVTWQQNPQRQGNVQLTTYLNNWKSGVSIPDCAVYCQTADSYTTGTCRQNSVQCTKNGETYEVGGNSSCVNSFPGDPSHDTCCCL